nr:hypothetical protein [Bacillota bacterium]
MAFALQHRTGAEQAPRPGREEAAVPGRGARPEQLPGAPEQESDPTVPMLSLAYHETSGRWMAVYKDPRTGEVLKTVPPEELLDAVGRIRQVLGLFLDTYR